MRTGEAAHHKRVGDSMEHLHTRISECENSIAGLIESNRKISETLSNLAENVGRVAEVLEAFNNAKGFWVTIRFISGFVKLLLPIAAFGGLIWAGITMYLKGKS